MKSSTIPPVHLEPEFREELEQALEDDESRAAPVEKAVRSEVARRHNHSEFVRRGMESIDRSEASGDWAPAEKVLAKLEAKVVAARARQKAASA